MIHVRWRLSLCNLYLITNLNRAIISIEAKGIIVSTPVAIPMLQLCSTVFVLRCSSPRENALTILRMHARTHKSLYPSTRFSSPLSATAQHQARPASPPKRDSGESDFSSKPSFSSDFISLPVVYERKCSKRSFSRARALPDIPTPKH